MTKEPTLHIDFLCYHQQFIPQLAEFLWKEWARFYLPFNITNIEQVKADLRKNCNIDRVPITLIATINSELVGTVSFGNDDLPATPYQPCFEGKESPSNSSNASFSWRSSWDILLFIFGQKINRKCILVWVGSSSKRQYMHGPRSPS
jgi:hypothetical protein